jgi:hypothetical protein
MSWPGQPPSKRAAASGRKRSLAIVTPVLAAAAFTLISGCGGAESFAEPAPSKTVLQGSNTLSGGDSQTSRGGFGTWVLIVAAGIGATLGLGIGE